MNELTTQEIVEARGGWSWARCGQGFAIGGFIGFVVGGGAFVATAGCILNQ